MPQHPGAAVLGFIDVDRPHHFGGSHQHRAGKSPETVACQIQTVSAIRKS
jgi:hypothetical protein